MDQPDIEKELRSSVLKRAIAVTAAQLVAAKDIAHHATGGGNASRSEIIQIAQIIAINVTAVETKRAG